MPLLLVPSLNRVVTQYMLNPLWTLSQLTPLDLIVFSQHMKAIQSSIFDEDRAKRTMKREVIYQFRSRCDFSPCRRHEYISVGKRLRIEEVGRNGMSEGGMTARDRGHYLETKFPGFLVVNKGVRPRLASAYVLLDLFAFFVFVFLS